MGTADLPNTCASWRAHLHLNQISGGRRVYPRCVTLHFDYSWSVKKSDQIAAGAAAAGAGAVAPAAAGVPPDSVLKLLPVVWLSAPNLFAVARRRRPPRDPLRTQPREKTHEWASRLAAHAADAAQEQELWSAAAAPENAFVPIKGVCAREWDLGKKIFVMRAVALNWSGRGARVDIDDDQLTNYKSFLTWSAT